MGPRLRGDDDTLGILKRQPVALRGKFQRSKVARQLDLGARLGLVQLDLRLGEALLRHLLRLALHRIGSLGHDRSPVVNALCIVTYCASEGGSSGSCMPRM